MNPKLLHSECFTNRSILEEKENKNKELLNELKTLHIRRYSIVYNIKGNKHLK